MKKDDLIEVTIEDLSEEGTGIGKFEGMTFFIKDAVIGDRMAMRPLFRRVALLDPSMLRISAPMISGEVRNAHMAKCWRYCSSLQPPMPTFPFPCMPTISMSRSL